MATYHVSFDTKDMPGNLVSVRVDIGKHVSRDPEEKFNIALCDDPLYPQLERYVLSNPSKTQEK